MGKKYLEDIGVVGVVVESERFVEGIVVEGVAYVGVDLDVCLTAFHYLSMQLLPVYYLFITTSL